MIITNKFVLLNFPKNGSTYLRTIIKKIHGVVNGNIIIRGINKAKRLNLPMAGIAKKIYYNFNEIDEILIHPNNNILGTYNKDFAKLKGPHASYNQIPHRHRKKPVLLAIRNPLERLVSLYEFGYWKGKYGIVAHPHYKNIVSEYPDFPNISFKEYFYIVMEHSKYIMIKHPDEMKVDVGPYSLQFLRFVMPEPDIYLYTLEKDDLSNGKVQEDIPSNIKFIHTEMLKEEFLSFLLDVGYKENKIKTIIDDSMRINSKKSKWEHKNYIDYYDEDMKKVIKSKEALLFNLFPYYSHIK